MLETFAEHDSQSLQHTLYAMGEAVLNNFDRMREIHLSLPNKHFNLVDLSPFGMDNPARSFLPTDEPHGLIEATLRRDIGAAARDLPSKSLVFPGREALASFRVSNHPMNRGLLEIREKVTLD